MLAPASRVGDVAGGRRGEELTRPRPWVIFTAVALLPFLDFGLRRIAPDEAFSGFRDLSTAVTLISVLPLLVARIAAERAELQQAGSTTRLLAQVIEQAQDLILVLTPDGRCRHANERVLPRDAARARSCCEAARARPDGARDDLGRGHPVGASATGGTWRGTVTRKRAGRHDLSGLGDAGGAASTTRGARRRTSSRSSATSRRSGGCASS